MKKILACFAIFAALIFVVSCGGGSKTGDNTNTGDTATDNDTGDSSSTDTEPGGGDTEPSENSDSDNPDTTSDDGDSTPDSDPSEPVNENPDNLPECSPTSATPCIDSETGLIWSGKSAERIRWIDAVDYCKNLKEGGYNDWRLPSIAVLRTLVKQCGSSGYSDGECSKFGDIVFFWSSNQSQGVFFYDGETQSKNVDETFDARCVRRENLTRKAACTGLLEHAEWNTVSEITQTWDWDQMWIPTLTSSYSEEPSTTQCQFKCEENYFWSEYNSTCVDYDTSECAPEGIIVKAEDIENYSQEEIQNGIKYYHDQNRSSCYGSLIEKEKIDTNGNLCIEDECNIGPNDIAAAGDRVWIDNLPFMVRNLTSVGLPPSGDIIHLRKVEQLNKDGSTDLTINYRFMTIYAKGIPTISCFAPNNVVDDASTIKMVPTAVGDKGCYADGQLISPSDIITTKNLQPKGFDGTVCEKVPNSTYSASTKTCHTTMTEFTWLENVVPYLYNQSGLKWYNTDTGLPNTKIEHDLGNNIFRMYFSIGSYSWIVELPNAKRCLDECYGIDGCEVSIKPSPDVSKGCIVKKP